jgi:hypothetical protein
VESDGVGVTSSILPIFIPERARARRADCAPGPGVLVPLPLKVLVLLFSVPVGRCIFTSSGSDLNVESVDAQFLASSSNILSSQHSSVWGGLVTIGLDLHASSHTSDGFAATGITQDVSLTIPLHACLYIGNFPATFIKGVRTRDR